MGDLTGRRHFQGRPHQPLPAGKPGLHRAIRETATYIEADYLRWAQFDKSPRTANHSPDGVIELMPTDDGKQYSFKYVNGHPDNGQKNLLTVMAFGLLADVKTGYPTLLSSGTQKTKNAAQGLYFCGFQAFIGP